MTIRPSDPDYWYAPDEIAPVPEGMETTAEERVEWAVAIHYNQPWMQRSHMLIRDLNRALAEIARLTAINADLLKTNLSHAEALARITELKAMTFDDPGDAIRRLTAERDKFAARIAELEAERDKWHQDAVNQMKKVVDLEAERDRLLIENVDLAIQTGRQRAELEVEVDRLKSGRVSAQAPLDRIAELEGERGTVAEWMIAHSYVTGHGDTTGDLLRELVLAEREACAVFCDQRSHHVTAALIRARTTP